MTLTEKRHIHKNIAYLKIVLSLSTLGNQLDFDLSRRQIEIRIGIQSLSMQSPFRVYDWGPYI